MHILIIDDDIDQRHQLAEAIAAAGHATVAQARDADEALTLAGQHPPDAILADPVIAGASATELIGTLCRTAPRAVVVMYGTPSERRFIQACHHAGADAYVLKTCGATEVVRRIIRLASAA